MKVTQGKMSAAKLLCFFALTVLLFCFAPVHAQSSDFKSTSAYPINASVQQPSVANQYSTYKSTIYSPFTEEVPSGSAPSRIGGRRNSGSDDDDVSVGGWTDTPGEPAPIGDAVPLFLFAAVMIAVIWIKQRKHHTTQHYPTLPNTTNTTPHYPTLPNTTQHMTTRKQTYQSFFQKLFLLLVFVCIAGQVSADKTIYFRPGTRNFSIGYQTKTQANTRTETANEAFQNSIGTYADVHWIKNSRIAYKVTGHSSKADIESKAHQTIVRDSVQSGKQSRFLPITIPTGYTGVKIYRTSSSTYTKFNSWSWVHGESNINKSNTIPVWSASNHEPSSSLSVDRADGKNLICNREGWYDEYYWAYYLPKNSGVKIYFADSQNWNNADKTNSIQMLTGKDIYTFPTAQLVNIKNTNLYYLELTKEYGYEYYGFILNSTAWSEAGNIPAISSTFLDATNTIKGFVDDSSITQSAWNKGNSSNANLNTYNNRIANRIKKATKRTGLCEDLLSGANLFIPGASNDAAVSKQTLGSWQDLNHTQTVIVEAGGKLNYHTTKLLDYGADEEKSRDTYSASNQTDNVTFTAAYTATTILRAKPDDGYYFLGFFDEATGELLTRGEKMTDAEGGYVYRYQAPNAPKTIRARFTPIKQVCIQYPTNTSWTAWNTESTGNILKINYTDLTGNPVEFTFDKYPTGNISEDVYITNDNYRRIYIKNIDIDQPLTFTTTEDNGYTFIGWRYNTVRFADNPWTVSDKSGSAFTARFVKFSQHTINVQTYNQEQNKYVLSEDGGSVEIAYKKLDHTQPNDFDRNYKTNVSLTDTYTILGSTSVTLTATPKDGYSFVGWYEGQNLVSKELTYTYTATEARNITAYFTKGIETTTLDVRAMIHTSTGLENSLDGGSFTMTHSGGIVYKHNTVGYVRNIPVSIEPVTFFATPNDRYEFIGWFNNKAGQFPDNPWIMQDPSDTDIDNGGQYEESVTAVFASQDYVVKQDVKIEGPGTVTANYLLYPEKDNQNRTFSHNFSFNAWKGEYDITLTANPLAGYEFDGWYDAEDNPIDGATGNTLTYKATSAHTITAKFKSEVNKLTVSVLNYNTSYNEFREYEYEYNTVTLTAGGETISSYSSLSKQFEDATEVTLTATPEDDEETGYDFIGWYQNNTLLSDQLTINVNVMGMQAISAHFAPKKCWKLTLNGSVGGLYSVKYARETEFLNQDGMYYIAHSQYNRDVEIYVPYQAKIAIVNPQPIHGYEYIIDDNRKGCRIFNETNPNAYTIINEYPRVYQILAGDSYLYANLARTEEQVVYLDISNKDESHWKDVTDEEFYCSPRSFFMTSTSTQQFEKVDGLDNIYKVTIPELFEGITIVKNGDAKNHTTLPLAIPSTRYNCFKLNAYQSSTGEWVDAWTTLDTENGDYRLIYIEQEVASKTEITRTYEFNEGDRIKKIPDGTKTDIVSLHIYNKVSKDNNGNLTGTALNNPEIILQQWSESADAWVDVERHMVFGPLQTDNTDHIRMPGRKNTAPNVVVDRGIDAIKAQKEVATKDYGSGVWNFYITQENGNVKLELDKTEKYTGKYYIRTTNADGQYNNFTHPNNEMTFSEYAKKNSDFSHYFVRYVDIYEDGTKTAEAGKHPVVKFTIANEHAMFLCKEFLIDNNRFTDDEYGNDIFVLDKDGAPNLPVDATVRFGWDIITNRLTRAYIANTTIKNNEYLVVEGDKIGSPTGDDAYFTDNSNWLYSIDLPSATTGATAKVKAKMNGEYQYFMGAQPGSQDEYETLISGSGTNTYPIRLLYDFKDDRFTTIYHPESGTITNDVELSTPLMIEREHNDPATQIQLETNKKITTVQAGEDQYTQPAYAVMTFLESVLADASKTHHEKMFYWISFPFDVCIRDVFGLGDYGKYWIMEYYDGEQRAKSGLAQNNWKYITKKSAILEKNKGYVLCLNYSQILQDQLFKSYGGSDETLNNGKLSLYFPSDSVISPADITGGLTREDTLAQYDNTTMGSNTAWNHHNWHIIGVPSFADPTLTKVQTDAPFVYQYWHPSDAYAAKAYTDITFHAMHAYMVQYHGIITWESVVNTTPKSLAARTDEQQDKKIMLRLELQQAGSTLDKTYVQLRNDKGTKGFDMSLDLTKIINAGANIYSIVDNHEMAGNAVPKEESIIPLGVVITAAGEYTFAMPNGTEGMMVELIDYEQGTSTNLLVGDYTVNIPVGTNNTRFALRMKPDKVATSVEDITSGTNDTVRKLLIDGVLYLQKGNTTYDAQGHVIR